MEMIYRNIMETERSRDVAPLESEKDKIKHGRDRWRNNSGSGRLRDRKESARTS